MVLLKKYNYKTIILFLFIVAGLFEVIPIVEQAREMLPSEFDDGYSCMDIVKSRPWYGHINPWAWLWFILTPVIVLSIKPSVSTCQMVGRSIFAIILSYLVINFGTYMAMDIWNASFNNPITSPISSERNKLILRCTHLGNESGYIFVFLFGWVFGLIYTGWCKIIWYQYHKRKTKLIDKNFKIDWFNKIITFASIAIPLIIAILVFIRYMEYQYWVNFQK